MKLTNKTKIIGVDAGDKETGFVIYNPESNSLCDKYIMENTMLLDHLELFDVDQYLLSLEMVACYGMPVGRNIFETCLWIGRIVQHWVSMKGSFVLIYRKDYKLHFCNSMKAKDSNIRQALIDRFGDKGTQKDKGFFFGIKGDMWSASAIALYTFDLVSGNLLQLKEKSVCEYVIKTGGETDVN